VIFFILEQTESADIFVLIHFAIIALLVVFIIFSITLLPVSPFKPTHPLLETLIIESLY